MAEVNELFARYPKKVHALLPILHLAQRDNGGWLPPGWDVCVAELCETNLNHVRGVVTFYNMFKRHPVGQYHLMVCSCLPCGLCGGLDLMKHLEEYLKIHVGGITADNLFSLEEAQCLAACDKAPLMMVNLQLYGPLKLEVVDEWIDAVYSGNEDAIQILPLANTRFNS